ncbi:SCO family protein [Brevibacillus sp. BC25]|uniref:SCO family protein n=1 Tax=Brevibacillus sp. BC25 TaxID=1144308 RepID=UPI0002711ADD|nr:SCO family protein [Brevibacillus sp. BC25]EJL22370.1 SCO1/SenC/PrrC protein [Brevibacillus sp. BC25]
MNIAPATAIRIRRLLLLLPVLVLVALVASWVWFGPKNAQAKLPDVTLQTIDGQSYSLAPQKKTVRLVELIYTRCPDICPTTTVKMVQLQKRLLEANLMGHDVEFLTITIDPQNDTPDVMRYYAKQLGIQEQGWTLLRGDEETIKTVTNSLGFFANKMDDGFISHTSSTYLVDDNNAVIQKFGMGDDFDPEQIYQELLKLKKEG